MSASLPYVYFIEVRGHYTSFIVESEDPDGRGVSLTQLVESAMGSQGQLSFT